MNCSTFTEFYAANANVQVHSDDGTLRARCALPAGTLVLVERPVVGGNMRALFSSMLERHRSLLKAICSEKKWQLLEPFARVVEVRGSDDGEREFYLESSSSDNARQRRMSLMPGHLDLVGANSTLLSHPIQGPRGHAISPMLCGLMRHDCAPNTQLVDTNNRFESGAPPRVEEIVDVDDNDNNDDENLSDYERRLREDSHGMTLYLYAAKDIASGEALTFSLVPFYMSHIRRRAKLKELYGIECRCHRCTRAGKFGGDKWLMGTVGDFNSRDDPDDAEKLKRMRADFDELPKVRPSGAALAASNSAEVVKAALDTWVSRLVAFTEDHKFLHPCHWRMWTVRDWLTEVYVTRAEYMSALKAVHGQMTALHRVAKAYPCRDYLVLYYRYRYLCRVIEKHGADVSGVDEAFFGTNDDDGVLAAFVRVTRTYNDPVPVLEESSDSDDWDRMDDRRAYSD